MFVELNEIKGLIILLEHVENLDEWIEISNQFSCSFILDSDNEISSIIKLFNDKTIFLKKETLLLSIDEAMSRMNIEPFETVVVSKNFEYLKTIQNHSRVGTLYINQTLDPDQVGHMPDYQLKQAKDIINTFREYPGFFAEVNTTIVKFDQPFSNKGIIFDYFMDYKGLRLKVVGCGRYYSARHYYKNRVHQLSHRILRSKNDDSQMHLFNPIFASVIKSLEADGITRVPPRPNGERDRFRKIVEYISTETDTMNCCDYLKCIEDFPKQKTMTNQESRAINVEGKFVSFPDCRGKKIVLIDDVITTGATVGECAKTLLEAGASEVIIVVLAVNQYDPIFPVHEKKFTCAVCGEDLHLRLFKNGKGFIYGCHNYSRADHNGSTPVFYEVGWKKINCQNILKPDDFEDDDQLFF
ncbi:ComF family protein [Paenibacillus polymyxa]|uniref:ComF family protein n=1 Tax=Paenibacillus polymyxa TaxID=1406 RepID=UPI0025B70DE6|nr:phosphoribosyltransferase family protein [Paenibacillus polymyxa]MDN4085986.1 phosphoribosyltransferase family protein [Paenibacillus polymyxa]MDN4111888.1 phosphoribosyltransferase family protein [Paenibacillus polymyxa]